MKKKSSIKILEKEEVLEQLSLSRIQGGSSIVASVCSCASANTNWWRGGGDCICQSGNANYQGTCTCGSENHNNYAGTLSFG